MFSNLIPGEDTFSTVRGTLFHDFAEFYLNYPKFVEDTGFSTFCDLILEELLHFRPEVYTEQIRSDIVYGVDQIVNYIRVKIASGTLKEIKLDGYKRRTGSFFVNFFQKKFKKPITSTITEMYFEDSTKGVKGVVDLIQGADDLLDYKSGKKVILRNIIKSSKPPFNKGIKPNFQAILYLSHLRRVTTESPLEFTFYYFTHDFKDRLVTPSPSSGADDHRKNFVTIKYYPTFKEFALDKETYEKLKKKSIDRRKILNDDLLTHTKYEKLLSPENIPDDLTKNSPEYDNLKTKMCDYIASVRRGPMRDKVESTLKRLIHLRGEIFLKSDLDLFDNKIVEWLEDINDSKRGKFTLGEINIDKIKYIDRSLMYIGED